MARIKRVTKPKKYHHMFSLMVTNDQMEKLQDRADKASIESGEFISLAEIVRRLIDAA
jgi:RNA polymerase-interacting CarD/CdnL/TRCF family regulator